MHVYKFILFFNLITFLLFAQINNDARMIGLNGAYTTLASGYQCVGINPANLGSYKIKSINLLNFSLSLNTNSMSIANYNAISGAELDDSTSVNYYSKENFYSIFNGDGLRISQDVRLPWSGLNMSIRNFALTSSINTNFDIGLPNGFLELMLYGNPLGSEIAFDMEQLLSISQDFGISYGRTFGPISTGFTLKYLFGLFYMSMESIGQPSIKTDITGFSGQNQYLLKQALGGSGIGLDLGLSVNKSKKGIRFGIALINLLGKVRWTQDNILRALITEQGLIDTSASYYLRPNEFMYINMKMDSVGGMSFLGTDGDPLIYYETYKVMPLNEIIGINYTIQDSNLVVLLSDSTYLVPSGGEYSMKVILPSSDTTYILSDNYSNLYKDKLNAFVTRKPMYLRLGFSKEWTKQAIIAVDLVTGFSNKFNSSTSWKLSIGTEIIRFKNRAFRFGYSFGGAQNRSIGFGYGRKLGKFFIDFGIALNGGFAIDTANGFDFSIGIIRKK